MSLKGAPLAGLKVVELAGLAPGPYCGRVLADWGARVVRVDKPHAPDIDRLAFGKRSIVVNSKVSEGQEVIRKLCSDADVLIDPFRPGVLERMNLGPSTFEKSNPGLIVARITGYGQTGPMKDRAGHDINYVAMSGVLSTLGRAGGLPTPPVNLLADFAGGGLLAAFGVSLALLARHTTGRGQVVDCSMTEGAAYVGAWLSAAGGLRPLWGQERGQNWLDSGAHFYNTYATSDGGHVAVGALEPQFYALVLEGLGLGEDEVPQFEDFVKGKAVFAEKFASNTLEHWCEVFAHTDACVTPVLTLQGAARDAHSVARDGHDPHPTPAPRLSGTPHARTPAPHLVRGRHTEQILQELGYSSASVAALVKSGAVELEE